MAKKKSAKKSAPVKKAPPAKKPKKTHPPIEVDELVEFELDAIEKQAIDLVTTSEEVCDDLEEAVTAAVAKTVGAVFKKHKVKLNAEQAENVALYLFGNEPVDTL